jgi:hypothetical protein
LENVYTFYGHLEYFTDLGGYFIILVTLVTFFVQLLHFPGFGIMYPEKSGNPADPRSLEIQAGYRELN